MGEYVDPVRGIPPKQAVDGHSESEERPTRPRAVVVGTVTSIHRKNVHHESGHILDTTVGGEEHTEIVVRIESGPFEDLDGRRVTITIAGS